MEKLEKSQLKTGSSNRLGFVDSAIRTNAQTGAKKNSAKKRPPGVNNAQGTNFARLRSSPATRDLVALDLRERGVKSLFVLVGQLAKGGEVRLHFIVREYQHVVDQLCRLTPEFGELVCYSLNW